MATRTRAVPRWAGRPIGYAWAGVATAITTITIVGGSRDWHGSWFERREPAAIVAAGVLGVVAMTAAAWVIGGWRPPVALGLATAIIGLLVPVWAGWPSLPPDVRALALGFAPLAVSGACRVALGWRAGGGGRTLAAVDVLALAATALLLVGYDPFSDPDCGRTCLPATPAAVQFVPTSQVILVSAGLTAVAATLGALGIVRAGRLGAPSVVRAGVIGALAALTLRQAIGARPVDAPSMAFGMIPPAYQTALEAAAAVALGVVALSAALSTARARSAIDALVRALADPLAGTPAAEPAVGVQFAIPGDGRWVTADGKPAPEPGARQQAVVVADEDGAALRMLVPASADPAVVIEEITPSRRLALRNAQLAAATHARLADIRASQRRIVTASDAERSRIERDLHDGAQQRLVGAMLHLSLAQRRDPANADRIARVEAAVGESLASLRRLGHGIFPQALATEGLGAALEDLVRSVDINIVADIRSVDGIGGEAAAAAYAAVALGLEHARLDPPADDVSVAASLEEGRLAVVVESTGGHPIDSTEVVDLADRVGALGGVVAARSIDHGFRLEAVVPCASS